MQKEFIFIDESGSPDFFGKRKRPLWLDNNFQPLLLLGMIVTKHRGKLRKEVESFQKRILEDSLYNSIYSVKQPNWFLHAKDDHPEVRIQFFEKIRQLNYFDCYIIIARKIPEIFINKHNGNAKEFYFDILHNLIQKFSFTEGSHYQFYLARRDKENLNAFTGAVEKVISKRIKPDGEPISTYQCQVVTAKDTPELSVLDYMLWAVQRYCLKGERRYFTALEGKFKLIYDVYDKTSENNLYEVGNPFSLDELDSFWQK